MSPFAIELDKEQAALKKIAELEEALERAKHEVAALTLKLAKQTSPERHRALAAEEDMRDAEDENKKLLGRLRVVVEALKACEEERLKRLEKGGKCVPSADLYVLAVQAMWVEVRRLD